jgi:creatinase/prolidase-like protein
MLTREGCARRQRRLQQQLEALGCDLFVTGDNRAAYYFTGSFSADGSPTVFALWQDGATELVTPSAGEALADQIRRVGNLFHPARDRAAVAGCGAALRRRAAGREAGATGGDRPGGVPVAATRCGTRRGNH